MDNVKRPASDNAGVVFGILLVLAGLVFLGAQLMPPGFDQYGWPLLVLVPGIALLAVGTALRPVSGLVVPGAMVTVTGAILAVQNTFGLWATWSYAWALVAPGAAGLGVAILGLLEGDGGRARDGLRAMAVGGVLFALFGAFFEGVLQVSGFAWGATWNVALAVLLIGLGAAVLVFRTLGAGSGRTPAT